MSEQPLFRLELLAGGHAPLASLDWQVHVHGTVTAELRAFAVGVRLPVFEWAWSETAGRVGLERDALYLVRPDGYIGLARRTQDVEAVRGYLQRFGINVSS